MVFKKLKKEQYGIPYMGSKTKLCDKICRFFPPAHNFYDIFGGGFSISHFMIQRRSKDFKEFHFNELRPGICELIQDAIAGKYNYDVFRPEWISRERFMAEKDTNAYIKIVWSFGNNGEDYLFNPDLEREKRSLHNAVIFDQFDDFMKDVIGLSKWPNQMTTFGKRLFIGNWARRIKRPDLQQLEQLQRLERLEQLQQLQRLEQLYFTSLDYKQVKIKPNSVIYCDPPYKGTADYGSMFNHDEFFDWAASQDNPLFISEYNVEDDRFYLIQSFKHRSTLPKEKNNSKTEERLYGNKQAFDIIEKYRTEQKSNA